MMWQHLIQKRIFKMFKRSSEEFNSQLNPELIQHALDVLKLIMYLRRKEESYEK